MSFLCVVKCEDGLNISKYFKKANENAVENVKLCDRQFEYFVEQLSRSEYWAIYS